MHLLIIRITCVHSTCLCYILYPAFVHPPLCACKPTYTQPFICTPTAVPPTNSHTRKTHPLEQCCTNDSEIQFYKHGTPSAARCISSTHERSLHSNCLHALTSSKSEIKDFTECCTHPFHLHTANPATHHSISCTCAPPHTHAS